MQHRLFHTLVIGGLLTGCGSVAELAPEPATPTPDGQPFPNVDAAPAVPDAGFDGNSPIEAGARPDGGPSFAPVKADGRRPRAARSRRPA
jgi:hypothetical protein